MNTNAVSLDRLHDIVVPAPAPWWPPAPGWYWVLGFGLVLILVLVVRGFIRWQHNRYRREALAELEQLEPKLNSSGQRAAGLLALSELLKRTALTAFPREQVATLTGTKWFAFLDQTAKGSNFSLSLGMTLETSIYDPRTADTLDDRKLQELTAAVRHWIKNHKAETKQKDAMAAKNSPGESLSLSSLPSVEKPC
ncbi:MAG TPA: DUF4381 domain-containing protein [Verrucomicrobiae bacterium]|nr:DUF4381 domain-containing protein [Verrucomicrobiae bacterium]